ncbi:hypothetical protein BN129_1389 [Cronobacter sakazakii 701]|nr:hypothetical protein BN129_1389 [Cronobacter sakazakii 701]
MFGDFQPHRGGHKGAGGRDINTVAAIAAGADNIRKGVIRARERRGVFQQGAGGPGNLNRVFAAHFHAHQRGSQLFGFQLAAHHRAEKLMALFAAQHLGLIEFFQNRLDAVLLFGAGQRPGERLFQQASALRRQDRLRVKLEAADAVGVVTHGHHHTVEVRVLPKNRHLWTGCAGATRRRSSQD